jgi:hypothetical protein
MKASCNYRIYGDSASGYKLIDVVKDRTLVDKYIESGSYSRVLVIRHDIELDMDEPILLVDTTKGKGPYVKKKQEVKKWSE